MSLKTFWKIFREKFPKRFRKLFFLIVLIVFAFQPILAKSKYYGGGGTKGSSSGGGTGAIRTQGGSSYGGGGGGRGGTKSSGGFNGFNSMGGFSGTMKSSGGGGGGGAVGGGDSIAAAIHSKHSIEYIDVPSTSDDYQSPVIEVSANSVPLNLIFRSSSSNMNVVQYHDAASIQEPQETFSEDQPHMLFHTVKKPIIQEIREIISPFRKITQQIDPVQEVIQTIIARTEQNHQNQQNQQNHQNQQNQQFHSNFNVNNNINKNLLKNNFNNQLTMNDVQMRDHDDGPINDRFSFGNMRTTNHQLPFQQEMEGRPMAQQPPSSSGLPLSPSQQKKQYGGGGGGSAMMIGDSMAGTQATPPSSTRTNTDSMIRIIKPSEMIMQSKLAAQPEQEQEQSDQESEQQREESSENAASSSATASASYQNDQPFGTKLTRSNNKYQVRQNTVKNKPLIPPSPSQSATPPSSSSLPMATINEQPTKRETTDGGSYKYPDYRRQNSQLNFDSLPLFASTSGGGLSPESPRISTYEYVQNPSNIYNSYYFPRKSAYIPSSSPAKSNTFNHQMSLDRQNHTTKPATNNIYNKHNAYKKEQFQLSEPSVDGERSYTIYPHYSYTTTTPTTNSPVLIYRTSDQNRTSNSYVGRNQRRHHRVVYHPVQQHSGAEESSDSTFSSFDRILKHFIKNIGQNRTQTFTIPSTSTTTTITPTTMATSTATATESSPSSTTITTTTEPKIVPESFTTTRSSIESLPMTLSTTMPITTTQEEAVLSNSGREPVFEAEETSDDEDDEKPAASSTVSEQYLLESTTFPPSINNNPRNLTKVSTLSTIESSEPEASDSEDSEEPSDDSDTEETEEDSEYEDSDSETTTTKSAPSTNDLVMFNRIKTVASAQSYTASPSKSFSSVGGDTNPNISFASRRLSSLRSNSVTSTTPTTNAKESKSDKSKQPK